MPKVSRNNKGRFTKGHKSYPRSLEWRKKMSERLKKNPINYWLGKKRPDMVGHKFWGPKEQLDYFKTHFFRNEKHPFWKGDKVSYAALHQWIYRKLGFPDQCEHCNFKSKSHRKIQWANISRKYKRDKEDWMRLCAKCHYAYDRGSYA